MLSVTHGGKRGSQCSISIIMGSQSRQFHILQQEKNISQFTDNPDITHRVTHQDLYSNIFKETVYIS